ncbi:MAG TPA: GAF domain-containing protein [Terriglobales bacterium]|nr:GAF domain-containing protein [Terriglobales bacterium]
MEKPFTAGLRPLDEDSFTRLLAAAYVMQEHQEETSDRALSADLSQVISTVVATQREIHSKALDFDSALSLISTRLQKAVTAAGVAIGVVDRDVIRYHAANGSASFLRGTSAPLQLTLARDCIRTGEAFRSPCAQTDPRLVSCLRPELAAQAVFAVPIANEAHATGAIEIYYSSANGFGDDDVRAAELFAALSSEVSADSAEQTVRTELDAEREGVLLALKELEPELEKLSRQLGDETSTPQKPEEPRELCRACGHPFSATEGFCGVCGASRVSGKYPGSELQSKWAVLWERQYKDEKHPPIFRKAPPKEDSFPPKSPALDTERDIASHARAWEQPVVNPDVNNDLQEQAIRIRPAEDSVENEMSDAPAASALVIRPSAELPETLPLEPGSNLDLQALMRRPGDVSLTLAALVLLATSVWALWPRASMTAIANASVPSQPAIKRKPRPKAPELTLLEKALVGLGLAVPPPTPAYMGDPSTKVWEDLQTALYYCPGMDLYGATPKGRFTTQAEAQQDSFEPAFRKPCD